MEVTTYVLFHGLALTSYASTIKITANFDNLTASVVPNPTSNIGTYKFITYNAFSLADTVDLIVGGVPAHIEPNAIVTNSEQQGINGTPSLTIAKPYTSFELTDFWFGCSANTGEAAAALAIQCTCWI